MMNEQDRKWQDRNRSSFLRKKSNLDQMVRRTFIDGDRAVIPCRASSYEDLITAYSVRGYESLNPAFQSYLMDIARFIPDEYPIELEIHGGPFSPEEQQVIERTVRTDMLYALGEVELQQRSALRNFWLMVAGAVGMGIFLTMVNFVVKIEEEFFYIVFWFFADTVVRYLLHDRGEKKYSRLLAGRMAGMTVRFPDCGKTEKNEGDTGGSDHAGS